MKRLLLVVVATALLVAPSLAQTQNDITIPEFRQVLVDLGSYLDARKGTDFARQFQAIDNDVLMKMYPAVPNPREFQRAVATLKQHAEENPSGPRARADSGGVTPLIVYTDSSCANSIIANSPAACNPAYPPPTDSGWQFFVAPMITADLFNGVPSDATPTTSDYDGASPQGCGLDQELALQEVSVILTGLLNSLTPICAIIPAPLNAVCLVPLTLVAVADAVSQGLYSDCIEQDGLVNGAKVDAAFQNTVTIYNALGSNSTTTLATDIANANSTLATDITNSITTVGGDISTGIATLALDVSNSTSTLATDLSSVNTTITGEFNTLETNIANDFATTNLNLFNDFTALTTQITALAGQLTQGTALLDATLKQVMKLELEPEGTQKIVPAILTCTGTNCPNVLNKCPAAGCSWNNVGPLP